MVGSWNTTFLLGFSYFQGRTVSFREGISSYPLKDLPFQRPSTLPSCDVIQTPSRLGAWSSSHGLGEIETFLKHILIYAHIMISYIHSLSILINPYQSLSILINPYQSLSILPISVETNWESSMIVPACSLSSTKYGRRTHPIRRETTHTSLLHHGLLILGPLWHPEEKLLVVFICHLLLLNTLWG